ncbi:MAG: virulence RhuM family protein [Candidatus Magasanikbacteria bacterium]|nr:virulence RhuM family protein [Candidatus Magasanikbacteria bacterium]
MEIIFFWTLLVLYRTLSGSFCVRKSFDLRLILYCTRLTRANAKKKYMELTSWKDTPDGKIQMFDVSVAKNYLTETELFSLERMVSAYLDIAEDMATRHIPMTMTDWAERLDRFIRMTDRNVLSDAGKVTHELAKEFAETEFEKYRIVQDRLFESDFDQFVQLEKKVEKKNKE